MERRLYLARKQFERMHAAGEVTGYICSLSSKVIVYKAMCAGRLLAEFFPDLASADYVTPFAIFHQRYATNTAAHVAPRPARPHARAQRRDQHRLGQSRPHGSARLHPAARVQARPHARRHGLHQPG